jgi:hypothetical protein
LSSSQAEPKNKAPRGQGEQALAGAFHTSRPREAGQIVVEYVLLLVVGVSIAVMLTSMMVSRSEDSPGFVIQAWRGIIEAIASDEIDVIVE